MKQGLQKEHKKVSTFRRKIKDRAMRSFLLCFLLFSLKAYACEDEPSHVLNPIDLFQNTQMATLFCTKKKEGKCVYFNKNLSTELRDATVMVSGSGNCSGVVIKLKRGGVFCEKPLLLTAGHCVDPVEKTSENIYFGNHKTGLLEFPTSNIYPLQKQCLTSQKQNCLVTPQEILDDGKVKLPYLGVDQALIPISPDGVERMGLEVDLDKIAKKEELGECFEEGKEATVTSYLSGEHITAMDLDKPPNDIDYIKGDTCKDLIWLKGKREAFKETLGHRCPTLPGMSGSFLTIDSCNNKRGLFVHRDSRLIGASEELKEKAKNKESIDSSEYEGIEHFKNTATYIDPQLLELYAKKYCNFPSPTG